MCDQASCAARAVRGMMAVMGYRYHVSVERTDDGFIARNDRGAELRFGTGGEDPSFSPVELMLVALGGCNLVTVEPLTAQRGHRLVKLAATIEAEKIKPNQLGTITMTYDVELPPGDADAAKIFHDVAHRVHERACTVSTSLEQRTTIDVELPV